LKKPIIRLWDLETSHNLVATFSLFGQDYIPHDNLLQERYIICGSYVDLHDDKVYSVSVLDDPKRYKKNPHDDYHVVKAIADALQEADVIVAHNGNKYDLKFLKGRMLYHKLPPLPPIVTLDTYLIAKRHFLLNSNKLDYIGKYLGIGQKLKTSPGLWLRVLGGDQKAVKDMVTYNREDCVLLKKVFKKMLGYLPDMNQRLYGSSDTACTRCGSTHVQKRGVHTALTRTYQRYQCQNPECGGWFRDDKPLTSTRARSL
jgi:hypothetical protein